MKPFFSVVIPLFNKQHHIERTIESVLQQTFTDFEIIVINDGSTDRSEALVSQIDDPRIRLVTQENLGAGAARNSGIKLAKGELVALLDADDQWHPFFLEQITTLIKAYPEHSVYATAFAYVHEKRSTPANYSIAIKEHGSVNFFEASCLSSILSSSSIAFRKNVVEQVGLLDTTIVSGQDTDYWIRIGLLFPIAFSRRICVLYHRIDESLSNKAFSSENKPPFTKWLEEEKSNPPLKKFLDLNRYSLAIRCKAHGELDSYRFYRNHISSKSLNKKQRFLLDLPGNLLSMLFRMKNTGKKLGVHFSAFE